MDQGWSQGGRIGVLTFAYFSPCLIPLEVSMEVQAHTTPESRLALRKYLRDRRMTTSVHQTITMQTLNDLEEALRLLQGAQHPSDSWAGEIEAYLDQRLAKRPRHQGTPLPGLNEEG
jgi:hypothetical protein